MKIHKKQINLGYLDNGDNLYAYIGHQLFIIWVKYCSIVVETDAIRIFFYANT